MLVMMSPESWFFIVASQRSMRLRLIDITFAPLKMGDGDYYAHRESDWRTALWWIWYSGQMRARIGLLFSRCNILALFDRTSQAVSVSAADVSRETLRITGVTMFEPNVIFQRTQAGRDEIYEKQRRLTQSERLVLIMVDGTTSYQGVRNKLPVLTEERFQRALTTLHKKELILEVFLPIEGQQPEEMEQTVI
ncbi:MAG: hypothetical protein ACM34A_04035, partial [Bacillota bacterium]